MSQDYESPLRVVARRHDLIGVHLYDPREKELPNAGLIRAQDAERGSLRWVDTSDAKVRQAYKDWFEKNYQYFRDQFLRSGADTISIATTESYVNALHHFFQRRS